MSAYSEKLRDPRWQRRRLEILSRAQFSCESCGDGKSTLHVHHKIYRKGIDPWDHGDDDLVALCEACHAGFHLAKQELNEVLCFLEAADIWALVGYANGRLYLRDHCSHVHVENHECAAGIADAIGATESEVLALVDEHGNAGLASLVAEAKR